MENPKNYPFRAGAFCASLEMIKYNHDLARLLDFDEKKLAQLKEIVDNAINSAEKMCAEYEGNQ
jgi:hypothetical protein